MAFSTVEVKVPDINKYFQSGGENYSTPNGKKGNAAMMRKILSQYGVFIRQWSLPLGLPDPIIAGFIATESGGREKPVQKGGTWVETNAYDATGLMQITPIAFYDCVTKWSSESKEPIPPYIVNELRIKVPSLLQKPFPAYSTVKSKILLLLQKEPSFNILAGCLYLRWLCERFSSTSRQALFNRVLVAYNAGAYTSSQIQPGTKTQANKNPVDTTTLVNSSNVPSESRAYLVKMLGIDGFLDLYYKQKLV